MNYLEVGTIRCFGLPLNQEGKKYILSISVDHKKIKVFPAKAGQFYLFCERTLVKSIEQMMNN